MNKKWWLLLIPVLLILACCIIFLFQRSKVELIGNTIKIAELEKNAPVDELEAILSAGELEKFLSGDESEVIIKKTELNDTQIKEAECYSTAEEFETALNSGNDVTGAIVTFTAGITAPGPGSYNTYAGKKLAFISNNYPNIDPGSTVTVKVKSVKNVEGTWNIEYE